MQKFKRLLASFITVISLLALNPVVAHAEWKSNSTGWWYTEGNSYAQWWKQIDGKWYYFYSDGYMAHDEYIGDYYLNSNGAWTTASASSTSTSSVSNSNDKSQIAYITPTGKKYHRIPKCGNTKSSTQTTVEKAEQEGYGPCSKCW